MVVAGALGVMAFGAVVVQRANRVGWTGVAPTTLVIAMLPRAGEEMSIDPATGQFVESPWSAEMGQRVRNGDLPDWQWRWALSRTRVVQVRRRLPKGEPALVRVSRPRWLGTELRLRAHIEDERVAPIWTDALSPMQAPWSRSALPWHEMTVPLSDARRHTLRVNLRVQPFVDWPMPPVETAWDGTFRYPIVRVSSAAEALRAARGESLEKAAMQAMQVRVSVRDWIEPEEQQVRLTCVADLSVLGPHRGVAFGFVADLLCDGVAVASFTLDDRPLLVARQLAFGGSTIIRHDGPTISEDPSRWSVRIRGDANASLRWVDCDRYWAGEFIVPMDKLLKPSGVGSTR